MRANRNFWQKLAPILLTLFLLTSVFVAACGGGKERTTPTPVLLTPTQVSPNTSPTATSEPTVPPGFALYRNTDYGFSITYPEDWLEQKLTGQGPLLRISAPAQQPIVLVSLNYVSEDKPVDQQAALLIENLKQELSKFELSEQKQANLSSGTPAYEIVFTWKEDDSTIKAKILLVIRGSQIFEIDALSPAANFDRNKDTLDKMLYSFNLEEPQPFGISRQESLSLFDVGPNTLDPAISREAGSHLFVSQIFSGLVTLDENMKVVSDMAQSWDNSADGKTYTFHLRPNAKFHDGKPITAQDFKYSWERAADPATGSQTAETYLGDIVGVKQKLAGQASEISGVRVVDDLTLEVTIDAPKVYFLSKLTYPTAFVVDRANVGTGEEWWRQPNGSGSFKLKEWKTDELLVLEANENYYRQPPQVKYLVFRLWGGVPMMMYETGEIDVADVSLNEIERVSDPASSLNKELQVAPLLTLTYISFNTTKPPFDDVLVRRAFSMALNKERLVSQVLKGMALPAQAILPPGMPGYDEGLQGLGYDTEQAKQLLAQSRYGGAANLPPITMTMAGRGGDVSDLISAIIEDWKQNLGVEVSVRQLEPETFDYSIKEEKDELFISGWMADYPDPENFLDVLFHSQSQANDAEYANSQVDASLEQARVEQDETRRLELYREAERLLVQDAACLSLWFDRSYVLVKPYVKGLEVNPLGLPTFSGAWLEPH